MLVDRAIGGDLTFKLNKIAERLSWCRYALRGEAHGGEAKNAETIGVLTDLLTRLRTSAYPVRIRLWIGGWFLDIENKEEPTEEGEQAIKNLAAEACSDPQLLTSEIVEWLLSPEAERAGQFWHTLGQKDDKEAFVHLIRGLAERDEGAHGFMLYVLGWCDRDQEGGREFFQQVAGDAKTTPRAILFGALEVDAPDIGADRILNLLNENRIDRGRVLQRTQVSGWLHKVSEEPLVKLLRAVAGPEFDNSATMPEIVDFRLHKVKLLPGALAEFAWECLEAHPITDRRVGDYHSDHLAARLVDLDHERAFRLLERCITDERRGNRWNPLDSGPNQQVFWGKLAAIDRERALEVVLNAAMSEERSRWQIEWHLPSIINLPDDQPVLLRYAERGEEQAKLVCRSITGGQIGFWETAFALIELYPDSERLRGELEIRVVQMGQVISGPYSEHTRGCLLDVKNALKRNAIPPAVRDWLEDFHKRLDGGLKEEQRREANDRVNRG